MTCNVAASFARFGIAVTYIPGKINDAIISVQRGAKSSNYSLLRTRKEQASADTSVLKKGLHTTDDFRIMVN